MTYNPPENRYVLSLSENITLPPRSIRRFMVPVKQPFDTVPCVLFEPYEMEANVFIAASVCAVTNTEIPVKIINNNEYPVIVNEHTKNWNS